MTIDWHLVAEIVVPILTLFLGAWVTRWFEGRPKLISYYGHASAFKFDLPEGKKGDVYTHSVVLNNSGRKSATNVRLRHTVLPSFQIFPAVNYSVVDLPDGGKDILIPVMIPGEQITINYLYFPPLTYANINSGIRSDEGAATQIPVLLQRQLPTWFNLLSAILALVGIVAILYAAVSLIRSILAR